jgi:hypothetical protein
MRRCERMQRDLSDSDADPAWWLYSLGDREGITWVLDTKRVGFSRGTAHLARGIKPGDVVAIHIGRGAYRNPTRDESQLLGLVRVRAVKQLAMPEWVAGKEIVTACEYDPVVVLPQRQGVPFRPVAVRMSFVKSEANWGLYFHSGVRRLTAEDAALIRDACEVPLQPR